MDTAGAGAGQEAALSTSAPKTTIRMMKEAKKDGLPMGKHIYSTVEVNSHCKREQMIPGCCSGHLVKGSMGWARELTLECKVLPTFWKVARDSRLDHSLPTTRSLEAKPCRLLGVRVEPVPRPPGVSARCPCPASVDFPVAPAPPPPQQKMCPTWS